MVEKIREHMRDFKFSMSAKDEKRFGKAVKEIDIQLNVIMADVYAYREKNQDDQHLQHMK